jgi:hypothetical protein
MRFVLLVPALLSSAACGSSTPPSEVPASTPSSDAASDTSPAESPPSKVHGAGDICGGIAGFACAPGLYCSFAPEAACGAADQTGTCAPMPEMCTEEYQPVCGCNDKTYSNACSAAREGVSVLRQGECSAAKP